MTTLDSAQASPASGVSSTASAAATGTSQDIHAVEDVSFAMQINVQVLFFLSTSIYIC